MNLQFVFPCFSFDIAPKVSAKFPTVSALKKTISATQSFQAMMRIRSHQGVCSILPQWLMKRTKH